MSKFKNFSIKNEMIKAEKGKYTEYPIYQFSNTSFMKRDRVGGTPHNAKRKYFR